MNEHGALLFREDCVRFLPPLSPISNFGTISNVLIMNMENIAVVPCFQCIDSTILKSL